MGSIGFLKRSKTEALKLASSDALLCQCRKASVDKGTQVNCLFHAKLRRVSLSELRLPSMLNHAIQVAAERRAGKARLARKKPLTIGDLLDLSPFEIIRAVGGKEVRGYVIALRAQLRLRGFTMQDGPFLKEGSREALVHDIKKECDIDEQLAHRILDFLHDRSLDILE